MPASQVLGSAARLSLRKWYRAPVKTRLEAGVFYISVTSCRIERSLENKKKQKGRLTSKTHRRLIIRIAACDQLLAVVAAVRADIEVPAHGYGFPASALVEIVVPCAAHIGVDVAPDYTATAAVGTVPERDVDCSCQCGKAEEGG
jgi:hypothetical protein